MVRCEKRIGAKDLGVSSERDPNWYAFVTRPRHEKKVKSYLDGAGITSFLPVRKSLNQWRDRKKWVEAPLFSCYIFSYIPYVHRYDVLKVPSVVRIVGFNNKPTPVRAAEIEAIKTSLTANKEVDVIDGFLPGDRVRILTGVLAGQEGQLVDYRSSKWFEIHISAICKSILIDIRENKIAKL